METVYNRFNNFLPSEAELRTTIVIEATIRTNSYHQKCDVRNSEDAVIGSSQVREVERAGALGNAAACSLAKVQKPTRRAGAWNCVSQQTRPRRLEPAARHPAPSAAAFHTPLPSRSRRVSTIVTAYTCDKRNCLLPSLSTENYKLSLP